MSNAKRDRLAMECLGSHPGVMDNYFNEIDNIISFKIGWDARQPEIDKLRKALKEISKYHPNKGMVKALPLAALKSIEIIVRKALEGAE